MALLTKEVSAGRRTAVPRRRLAWLLALALLGAVAPRVGAQTETTLEYKVKAAFLFNFAQFVEWPARAFPTAESPQVIAVLGDDPFGAYLDELVRGEKVSGHPLVVRRYKRVEDIAECHILFISQSEAGALDQILAALKGRAILTVGDIGTFARQGGMIQFVTEEGKIRLTHGINVDAARACGLVISSTIIRPETIFKPGKD